jgi:queuine tRNA-ribosyltransferase
MCLDVVPAAGRAAQRARGGGRRTTLWASASARPTRAGPALFGIAQGAPTRAAAPLVEEIAELGFDGHALGGLAIGERREQMLETTAWAASCSRRAPALLHGHRRPGGILEVIERGIDMFDCVLPTRNARTGSRSPGRGSSTCKGARFARDPRPLDEGCACPACTRFSRAYVRHLLNQQEIWDCSC